MKKRICILFILCISLSVFSPVQAQQRKSVAVVLSGGGAKGVAHIGALKVIEEAGIPIDYIVGTSMGSIIGGLYSIGYTPQQLDSMVSHQNWPLLLSDRISWEDQTITERQNSETYIISVPLKKNLKSNMFGGVIKGQNLSNLFSELTVGYHDSISFNKLPIPFACVSENIVNGGEVVFHDGVLATAMRASMAIPGVFTPVRIDDKILVDGGMKNNFPTNVARAMGADVIIGVDVQNDLRTANELNNVSEIFNQIVNLTGQTQYEENIKLANVYIKVDVKGYAASSFNIPALDTLMNRGEKAAREQWTALKKLKKEIGLTEDYVAPTHGPFNSLWASKNIFVRKISFDGIEDSDKKWIMHRCHLEENSNMRMEQLYEALTILRGSQAYSNVSYKLTDTPQGYLLHFILEEKYERNLNLGIRFDSEEIASLLLNVRSRVNTRIPSWVSVTGRLGKRYLARVGYTLTPMQMRNFNFAYQFEYNDVNIYDHGKRAYNTTYKYHSGEFGFSDVWFHNLRFGVGTKFEYFKYKDFLYNIDGKHLSVKPQHFFSYFAQLHYNTYNKGYFPSKGVDVQGRYSLYTDNMTQYKGGAPFSALTMSCTGVFPLTNRFSFIPSLYGRVLIGENIPYPYLNAIGGENFGHYLSQQLPFAGISNLEIVENSVLVTNLKFRQRMGSKNYVTFVGNVALQNDKFFDVLKAKPIWGGSVGYGYDSLFGPLEASFGYSSRSKEVGFYINLGYVF